MVGAAPTAAALAASFIAATSSLNVAIDRWQGSGAVPAAVARPALAQQLLVFRLSADRRLERAVGARLPRALASDLGDEVSARRELSRLTVPQRLSTFRVGAAAPAVLLQRWYREAQRDSGVSWQILAAVNYVESDFNRLRSTSVSGAQGPMQFLPSSWRRYGHGDVHDPHAAILAAARYLHAAGSRTNLRRALYRYNPSWLYADAILRYAARIRRDERAFFTYYSRQLFVRTPSGLRRLTSFGLR